MRIHSLLTPSSTAVPQAATTFAVLARAGGLVLLPLLAACADRSTSPSGSAASLNAPSFSLAGPRAPALLVTSRVVSQDGTTDERPFRYDAVSGAFLGHLNPPVTPTSHREMAFGADGHLYVVDGLGNSVIRYDGQTGASLGAFVPAGRGLGNPSGLAFGPDGDLYVTNGADNRVKQYNRSTGALVRTYSGLSDPQSITFRSDGVMFVASRGYNDVRRYDPALGRFVVFVTAGNAGLSQPTSLRFGPDGNLYVASHGTGSVIRYNGTTGQAIGIFAAGSGLVAPGGILFGSDGRLYVSDFASGSVLRFDATSGAFVDTFIAPGSGELSSPRYLALSSAPVNQAPVINAGGPYSGLEGSAVTFDASATTDANGDAMTFAWSFGDGSSGSGASTSHVYADNGVYAATLTVTDERGATSSAAITVTIDNAAPALTSVTAPSTSALVGQELSASVSFTDAGSADTHLSSINWGDGTTTPAQVAAGIATGSHAYTTAGTYTITVTVTDNDGASVQLAFPAVQVATPSTASTPGSVIGAGRILSPVGAYTVLPTRRGTAAFSVVARYVANAEAPIGSLSFNMPSGGFDFRATSFESLVIDGSQAALEGEGLVNRKSGYAFRLSVTDAVRGNGNRPGDGVRLQVWHVASGRVIYDNERASAPDAAASSPIVMGSIAVQTSGSASSAGPGGSDSAPKNDRTSGKPGKGNN